MPALREIPKPSPPPKSDPKPRRELPWRVRVTPAGDGEVFNNRVLKVGQILELPAASAIRRVRDGLAEWTTRVQSLKENVQVGNFITAVGEVRPSAPDRAEKLAALGLVRILPDDDSAAPVVIELATPTPVDAELDDSIRRKRAALNRKD